MLNNFYIFNRKGRCLYYKEWDRPLNTMSDDPEEERKLVFGMLFSLKDLALKLSPDTQGLDSLHIVKTNTFTLHHFQSPTGLMFVLNTHNEVPDLHSNLQHVYSQIYVDCIARNPLYRHKLDEPLKCTLFATRLEEKVLKSLKTKGTDAESGLELLDACVDDIAYARKLLSNGNRCFNWKDPESGASLLHLLSYTDSWKQVNLLLEYGADPNLTNKNNETALHWCAKLNNKNSAKTLIKYKCNVNAIDNSGSTALHIACSAGNLEMVPLLLDNFAAVQLIDNNGCSAIEISGDCKTPSSFAITILLLRYYHEQSLHPPNNIRSKYRNFVHTNLPVFNSQPPNTNEIDVMHPTLRQKFLKINRENQQIVANTLKVTDNDDAKNQIESRESNIKDKLIKDINISENNSSGKDDPNNDMNQFPHNESENIIKSRHQWNDYSLLRNSSSDRPLSAAKASLKRRSPSPPLFTVRRVPSPIITSNGPVVLNSSPPSRMRINNKAGINAVDIINSGSSKQTSNNNSSNNSSTKEGLERMKEYSDSQQQQQQHHHPVVMHSKENTDSSSNSNSIARFSSNTATATGNIPIRPSSPILSLIPPLPSSSSSSASSNLSTTSPPPRFVIRKVQSPIITSTGPVTATITANTTAGQSQKDSYNLTNSSSLHQVLRQQQQQQQQQQEEGMTRSSISPLKDTTATMATTSSLHRSNSSSMKGDNSSSGSSSKSILLVLPTSASAEATIDLRTGNSPTTMKRRTSTANAVTIAAAPGSPKTDRSNPTTVKSPNKLARSYSNKKVPNIIKTNSSNSIDKYTNLSAEDEGEDISQQQQLPQEHPNQASTSGAAVFCNSSNGISKMLSQVAYPPAVFVPMLPNPYPYDTTSKEDDNNLCHANNHTSTYDYYSSNNPSFGFRRKISIGSGGYFFRNSNSGIGHSMISSIGHSTTATSFSTTATPSHTRYLDVIIAVEQCCDCHLHNNSTLHHDVDRYMKTSQDVLYSLIAAIAQAKFAVRLFALRVKPIASNRLGALEVTIAVNVSPPARKATTTANSNSNSRDDDNDDGGGGSSSERINNSNNKINIADNKHHHHSSSNNNDNNNNNNSPPKPLRHARSFSAISNITNNSSNNHTHTSSSAVTAAVMAVTTSQSVTAVSSPHHHQQQQQQPSQQQHHSYDDSASLLHPHHHRGSFRRASSLPTGWATHRLHSKLETRSWPAVKQITQHAINFLNTTLKEVQSNFNSVAAAYARKQRSNQRTHDEILLTENDDEDEEEEGEEDDDYVAEDDDTKWGGDGDEADEEEGITAAASSRLATSPKTAAASAALAGLFNIDHPETWQYSHKALSVVRTKDIERSYLQWLQRTKLDPPVTSSSLAITTTTTAMDHNYRTHDWPQQLFFLKSNNSSSSSSSSGNSTARKNQTLYGSNTTNTLSSSPQASRSASRSASCSNLNDDNSTNKSKNRFLSTTGSAASLQQSPQQISQQQQHTSGPYLDFDLAKTLNNPSEFDKMVLEHFMVYDATVAGST